MPNLGATASNFPISASVGGFEGDSGDGIWVAISSMNSSNPAGTHWINIVTGLSELFLNACGTVRGICTNVPGFPIMVLPSTMKVISPSMT